MKAQILRVNKFSILISILSLFLVLIPQLVLASDVEPAVEFIEYKAKVIDKVTGRALPFSNIILQGTNITTITNTEGEFSLKVPTSIKNPKISIRYMGYKNRLISLTEFSTLGDKIELQPITLELPEISVISKDAVALVDAMMNKIEENYSISEMLMTAFYRETIKKNKSYASLSEAVVDIYKQSYTNQYKTDLVKLYKARKQTDYNKVDTLIFKLMGGPFNCLYLDVMKNPVLIFTDNMMKNYEFSFERSTRLDNRLIYIVDFKQNKDYPEPLYFGKLYIDAQSLALKTAIFSLNIENRDASTNMFVIKKPFNARVYPVQADYRIDYTENDGKWYYSYSRVDLGLRINWKRKIFNTTYYASVEMAVTDRKEIIDEKSIRYKERMKPSVIISDESNGFSEPDFWGEYNVIEPERSIESAIKKIQKKLEKK
jgi:hypothetical protein